MNKTFVISVGGSVLFSASSQEHPEKFSDVINSLVDEGHKFVLVVGGGKKARVKAEETKAAGKSNFEVDEAAIEVTRENASLLIPKIKNSHPEVLKDVKKAKQLLAEGKTPVYGGLVPGATTDFVAALIAEFLGNTTLINLSNTTGIYSTDPRKDSNAKLFPNLSYEKLIELILQCEMKPAQNIIFDLPACLVIKRSKIKTFFLDGKDLENFKNAVHGKEFTGTIVQ